MTKHYGKPLHFLTKKIAFSYSDPGATLQNKLNDLKPVPLYSRKKSFVFQKKLKKMLLHWSVNLANQNKQQLPQEDACHVPYMTSQYETNLWSTHVNIVRLAEPIRRCVRWRTQVFKNRGVGLQAFPSFPSSSPLFHFLALASFLARSKLKIPFLSLFFALKLNGNACYKLLNMLLFRNFLQ